MRVTALWLALTTCFFASVPALLAAGSAPAVQTAAPVISLAEAREKLGSPDVIFIDVRSPVHWGPSDGKIPGARHEEPKKPEGWLLGYPRDKTLILYCA